MIKDDILLAWLQRATISSAYNMQFESSAAESTGISARVGSAGNLKLSFDSEP